MHYKLTDEIIKLSVSSYWNDAKLEWNFEYAYQSEEPQTCLCGHYPIRNICVIRNQDNSNETEVGNCCINKFLGIEEGNKIFTSISRLKEDITKSMSAEVLDYLNENGSVVSAAGLFRMSCMKNPTTSVDETWNVSLGAKMQELKPGTYQMNTDNNNADIGGYYNYVVSKTGYTSTSGSIIISKVVAGQTVGNSVGAGNDYYIDGSFEMTLVDTETPPNSVTITGTFSGINIKTN